MKYRNFIYDESRGFVFVYVPKVACTNWKAILRQMLGFENWLDPSLAHDRSNGGLRYLDAAGPERAILLDPSVKKYTMVRNPYTRLLSAYLNKFESRLNKPRRENGKDFFDEIFQEIDLYRLEALGNDAFPEVTFEVFIRWIANKEKFTPPVLYMRTNEHWARQSDLLLWPEIQFDIIGRFENMREDSNRILQAMGSEMNFPTQLEVKFAPTDATSKIEKYFTPIAVKIIAEWFRDDFSALGYSSDFPN